MRETECCWSHDAGGHESGIERSFILPSALSSAPSRHPPSIYPTRGASVSPRRRSREGSTVSGRTPHSSIFFQTIELGMARSGAKGKGPRRGEYMNCMCSAAEPPW